MDKIMYYPLNDFSKTILASIPKKVMFWVSQLQRVGIPEEKLKKNSVHGLSWYLSNDPSEFNSVQFFNPAAIDLSKEVIEICWLNDEERGVVNLCGNQEFFSYIDKNLSDFTEVENDIYGALTKYEAELERDFSTLQTD